MGDGGRLRGIQRGIDVVRVVDQGEYRYQGNVSAPEDTRNTPEDIQ
jgi:hypothetical protein